MNCRRLRKFLRFHPLFETFVKHNALILFQTNQLLQLTLVLFLFFFFLFRYHSSLSMFSKLFVPTIHRTELSFTAPSEKDMNCSYFISMNYETVKLRTLCLSHLFGNICGFVFELWDTSHSMPTSPSDYLLLDLLFSLIYLFILHAAAP